MDAAVSQTLQNKSPFATGYTTRVQCSHTDTDTGEAYMLNAYVVVAIESN
jgi:hypothetical protein